MKEKYSKQIYLCIFILGFISIINLYNAKYLMSFYKLYYIKQLIWYLCGFITIYFCMQKNLNSFFKYSKYFYWFTNLILLYLLFFERAINGTKAWLTLGPISIQPSEFMKIFLTALLIEISMQKEKKEIKLLKCLIYTIIPCILVFLEPDTGAIIFYLLIFFTCSFLLKLPFKYYLILFLTLLFFLGIFAYLYIKNQDILINLIGTSFFYRVERLLDFRNMNYQLELSLISIFASPFVRWGLNNISLYVPEGATDFIFAFSTGNFGQINVILIITFYYFLINAICKLLEKSRNKKTNYFIISFLVMFILQISINIMMNIGLLPIIGITLPFISYGGSSTLVYFFFIGIILSLVNKESL